MEPVLRPGDWLLVRRTRRIRPGQVVLARHPGGRRCSSSSAPPAAPDGGWWLESDNPDGRRRGQRPVRRGAGPLIEGRVLVRYWRPRRPRT